MKKNPLFRLEQVQTTINLMNLSHIFRNGDRWTAVTGSGSEYALSDDEYARIQEFFEPKEEPKGDFDDMLSKFGDMLKKFKEMGLRIDNA